MTDGNPQHKQRRTSSGGLEIREMEIGDLAAVYELGEELFTAERWPTLYRTWDAYELAVHFASDSEMCLVAEYQERVVGFAVGTMLEKRGSAWTYGHLLWLGVDPNAGRKGIGGRLTAHLQEVFIELGARMILVDTDADNTAAISFFKRAGFDDDSAHVYLSKNLTYDPQYIEFHKKGRVADRPGGVRRAIRRAAELRLAEQRQADLKAAEVRSGDSKADKGRASAAAPAKPAKSGHE
ncbi:MAG: GNAT family N-acetyltransferase [Deltaproteobacteria bacterium]|nr:GNAT family N-acetyltransferase [Deltaproteobacteria bacterium]